MICLFILVSVLFWGNMAKFQQKFPLRKRLKFQLVNLFPSCELDEAGWMPQDLMVYHGVSPIGLTSWHKQQGTQLHLSGKKVLQFGEQLGEVQPRQNWWQAMKLMAWNQRNWQQIITQHGRSLNRYERNEIKKLISNLSASRFPSAMEPRFPDGSLGMPRGAPIVHYFCLCYALYIFVYIGSRMLRIIFICICIYIYLYTLRISGFPARVSCRIIYTVACCFLKLPICIRSQMVSE